MKRWIRSLTLTGLMGGVAACSSSVDRPTRPMLAALVTGDAAAALQADGQFALQTQTSGEMTQSAAEALALAYARTAGHGLERTWEWERGAGTIDIDALSLCGRSFVAHSAYNELPPSVSSTTRQRFGSQWLVTLCGPTGQREVNIAVPVGDTALRLSGSHAIIGLGSAHFTSVGIPPGIDVPPSPEQAVEEVAAATGRRVAEVPELVLAPPPFMPQMAKWRLVLESPITATRADTDASVVASDVYFGFGSTWRFIGLLVGLQRPGVAAPLRDLAGGGAAVGLALRDGYANEYKRIKTEGK